MTQARFGRDDGEPEWVDVYWAHTIEEAHIVRGSLEAADIPAAIQSRESSMVYGSTALLGVGVFVPRALEDQARAVLEGGGDD